MWTNVLQQAKDSEWKYQTQKSSSPSAILLGGKGQSKRHREVAAATGAKMPSLPVYNKLPFYADTPPPGGAHSPPAVAPLNVHTACVAPEVQGLLPGPP